MRGHQLSAATLAVLLPGALVVALIAVLGLTGARNSSGDFRVEDLPGDLVAFYGDSFTVGMGASERTERWSSAVSVEHGWNEFNPSVNGLGFLANRDLLGTVDVVEQIVRARPDIVLSTMGLNDALIVEHSIEEIRAAVLRDFTAFEAIPGARVIVVEPFWPDGGRSELALEVIDVVESAANDHGFEYISGASLWLSDRPEWISHDGLHPNDDGHAHIAERMSGELESLGLTAQP